MGFPKVSFGGSFGAFVKSLDDARRGELVRLLDLLDELLRPRRGELVRGSFGRAVPLRMLRSGLVIMEVVR